MIKWISLSLFSCSTLAVGIAAIAPSASAQCVMSDVSIQAAIRGDRPAEQSNQVDLQSSGSCTGNSISQTNAQVYAGDGDRVRQQRTSRQHLEGGSNPTGVNGPTVRVPVDVRVDVYNPAYDPRMFSPRSR